ncbi:MAG: lysine exporter LysO family protein [Nitrososphaeria archaeon]|nr:lysine exporter LysO family protein [Nitrososphaeria archaeon]
MLKFFLALVVGLVIGRLGQNLLYSVDVLESILVDILLVIVGCIIVLNEYILNFKNHSKIALKSIFSAIVGSLIVAYPSSIILNIPLKVCLSISCGFGWYSFTGPFLSKAIGLEAGAMGLLTNLMRELITMLTSPIVGKKLGPTSIISGGGATACDTTLPFIIKYGGEEYIIPAIISGLVLTVAATLLVPLFAQV